MSSPPCYCIWPWQWIFHLGHSKQLTRFEGIFFGDGERRQIVGTIWELGPKSHGQLNWGDLAFLICNILVGPFVFEVALVSMQVHSLVMLCSQQRLLLSLGMERILSFGQITDCMESVQPLLFLFGCVSKRRANKRAVYDVLTNSSWISDIQRALSVTVIAEYLHLWDLLLEVELQPEVEDSHIWRFSPCGW